MTDQEPDRKPCPECGKEVTWTKAGKPRSHKCEPEEPAAPTSDGIHLDEVIAAFIKTRDEIDARKKALDAALAELKALQTRRTDYLKNKMVELGVTNIGNKEVGIAFFETKDSATVADGERFQQWVGEDFESRKFFLENRVSKMAVRQMLEDGETPPPGVNYTTFKDVKIRRA